VGGSGVGVRWLSRRPWSRAEWGPAHVLPRAQQLPAWGEPLGTLVSTCREVAFRAQPSTSNCTCVNIAVGGGSAGWGPGGTGAGASHQCPAGPRRLPQQWGSSASRTVPGPGAECGIPGAIHRLSPSAHSGLGHQAIGHAGLRGVWAELSS